MALQSRPKRTSQKLEIVAAVVLGILAILGFVAEASTLGKESTRLEGVLFGLLQFVLTVGFAWFSTRAISRADFEASLKRFAVSAYRRISDIGEMVQSLQGRIDQMRAERGEEDCHDLDLIRAVVDNTAQVVRSSNADWADVIGDELIALETIKSLELEKSAVRVDAEGPEASTRGLEKQIREIDQRIADLAKALPPKLQLDVKRDESDSMRAGFAAEWMARRHKEDEGLSLRAIAGAEYRADRDPDSLQTGEHLYIRIDPDSKGQVFDSSDTVIGRVLNNSPMSYRDFLRMLLACYGKERIAARFERVYAHRESGNVMHKWYYLKITDEPASPRTIASTRPAEPPARGAGPTAA